MNFYFNISVKGENLDKTFIGGVSSFEADCRVQRDKKIETEHFPRCSEDTEFVFDNGKLVKLEVLAASNQMGKKILTN